MCPLRIKICGITSELDGRRAAALGADAIGLNFYARSPRVVTPERARGILAVLPPTVDPVALFVNQPLAEVGPIVETLERVRTVQWHGDRHETDDPGPYRMVMAFPVRGAADLTAIERYLDRCRDAGWLPAGLLVDAHVAGEYGGTGRTAPWELLADFRPGVPVLLAGGLTPNNVAEAIRLVRPYAVDVASGVESAPGVKDEDMMRRFIAAAREAAAKHGLATDHAAARECRPLVG